MCHWLKISSSLVASSLLDHLSLLYPVYPSRDGSGFDNSRNRNSILVPKEVRNTSGEQDYDNHDDDETSISEQHMRELLASIKKKQTTQVLVACARAIIGYGNDGISRERVLRCTWCRALSVDYRVRSTITKTLLELLYFSTKLHARGRGSFFQHVCNHRKLFAMTQLTRSMYQG